MLPLHLSLDKKDQEGFDKLFLEHAEAMMKIANRHFKNRHLAEEAVQETFRDVIGQVEKKEKNLCDIGPGFLVNTMRWKMGDLDRKFKKKMKKETVIDEEVDPPDESAPVWSGMERGELRAAMAQLLRDLPQADRDLITMRITQGMMEEEIAELLGLKRTAVAMRLSRLKARLKKQLEEMGVDCYE